jgi:hypothetical protein
MALIQEPTRRERLLLSDIELTRAFKRLEKALLSGIAFL